MPEQINSEQVISPGSISPPEYTFRYKLDRIRLYAASSVICIMSLFCLAVAAGPVAAADAKLRDSAWTMLTLITGSALALIFRSAPDAKG
jgi:hypothetical protein